MFELFVNRGGGSVANRFSNIRYLVEDNFSVVPENTIIWEGELPFKEGDEFPTKFIQERANIFKTNEALYKCEAYDQIFDTIVNFNDYMRDAVTNYPIIKTDDTFVVMLIKCIIVCRLTHLFT